MTGLDESDQISPVVYVVYDDRDGKIIHTHRFMAISGAQLPSEDEQMTESLETACKHSGRRNMSGISAICVQSQDFKRGVNYEVDLREKKLRIKKYATCKPTTEINPLYILNTRLAQGEINRDEYEELRKIVQGTTTN